MTCSVGCGMLVVLGLLCPVPSRAEAPSDYKFEGYNHAKWWRSIYLGRFDLLRPGKCTIRGQELYFCDDGRDHVRHDESFADTQALTDITILSGAYVGYHRAWEKACKSRSSETTSPVTYDIVTTTTRGFSVTETGRESVTFHVRDRFVSAYRKDHLLLRNFDRQAATDLERLLADQDCGSELLTQFEDNLHRAILRAPSVQAERAGLARTPLFSPGCQQVLSGMNVKTPAEAACPCLYKQLSSALRPQDVFFLEENFTKERLLWMSVSEVGLHSKLAACLR